MKYLSPILDRESDVEITKYCRDSWFLVKCLETGIVFLPNAPEYSELESELSWENTVSLERERRNRDEPVLSRVSSFAKRIKRKLFPKRDKMTSMVLAEIVQKDFEGVLRTLDIGCAGAERLVHLYQKCCAMDVEIIPIGIEISKELAANAQANLAGIGGEAIQSSSLDAAQKIDQGSIHIIIMRSFLEHEKHPARLLKSLRKILAENGSIVIKVPNYACWNRTIRGNKWCGFRYPDHVNYFTPSTLTGIAKETGFVVSRQNILDKFPTSDSMYAVLKKNA